MAGLTVWGQKKRFVQGSGRQPVQSVPVLSWASLWWERGEAEGIALKKQQPVSNAVLASCGQISGLIYTCKRIESHVLLSVKSIFESFFPKPAEILSLSSLKPASVPSETLWTWGSVGWLKTFQWNTLWGGWWKNRLFRGGRKRLNEWFRFKDTTSGPQRSRYLAASCTLSLLEAQGDDVSHDSHERASHTTQGVTHWGCFVESWTVQSRNKFRRFGSNIAISSQKLYWSTTIVVFFFFFFTLVKRKQFGKQFTEASYTHLHNCLNEDCITILKHEIDIFI